MMRVVSGIMTPKRKSLGLVLTTLVRLSYLHIRG